MKTLAILLLLIGGAVAAAWLGGETWLARKAQAMIAEDPRVEASQVTPLREIDRIGLGLTEVEIATPGGDALLPEVPNSASNPAYRRHEVPPAANRADLRSRAASVASWRSGSRIRQDTPSTIKW